MRMGHGWSQEYVDENVRGLIYITNVNTDAQAFLTGGFTAPVLRTSGEIEGIDGEEETGWTYKVSQITGELLLILMMRLIQSNTSITIFDVEFTFIVNGSTIHVGAGNPKVPKWLKNTSSGRKAAYFDTWVQQEFNGTKINCAAFAIAYKMATPNQRKRPWVKRTALRIMKDLGWEENVSIDQILRSVKTYFKQYRITVVLPMFYNQAKYTAEGPDYIYADAGDTTTLTPECQKKTIYLVYDAENQHYGGCQAPTSVFPHWRWCNRCCSASTDHSNCNCHEEEITRKKYEIPPPKCRYCGLVKCKGEGCFRNCQFCGAKFSFGYDPEKGEGHRCIVYDNSTPKEFGINDEDGYQLWVYDLESAIVQSDQLLTMQFETDDANQFVMVGETVRSTTVKAYKHKVNLVVFRNVFEPDSEHVYFGDNCLDRFIEFMFNTNKGKNIAIAHNGSGYDTRLIFDFLVSMEQRFKPQTIQRGTKIMQLKVKNTVFKDSLLFLPSSLSNLAKSFDLPLRKGIFPHLFNSVENYDYEGSLPPKKFFDITFFAKNKKDVEEFHSWYAQRVQTPWNFKHELVEYCKDDVKILGLLVKQFHEICYEKFKISPWFSTTAPSYVHKVVINQISKNLEIPQDPEEKRVAIEKAVETSWAALQPEEYWFARRALRGGRTDVRKLRHVLTDDEKQRGIQIKYVDVVSMYPAVQVKYDYPIGPPVIHIYDHEIYPCYWHANPTSGTLF